MEKKDISKKLETTKSDSYNLNNPEMKINAGLGSVDEYIRFVKAGADEFFCGYVPYFWSKKYGTVMPLNRREVFCYNVQLGSFSELEILAEMIKKYKKPVHLTFNSLYYLPEQYPEIAKIIVQCMKLGFNSYIIADPALILYLREKEINCEIHLSGEVGEANSLIMEEFQKFKLKRLIFHRKTDFENMASMIKKEKLAGGERAKTEFEAFVLNEMCQFTGAFCNSLHCDEMGYLCRMQYQFKSYKDCRNVEKSLIMPDPTETAYDEDGYLCGESGCGLCALYQLQKAGVTHLKLVGRGNYADFMEKDIRNLRIALDILKENESTGGSKEQYIRKMKAQIFPGGCSRNCYYLSF